ncbi:MAG: metallophosphoesterase, partial [Clostridia bacterium]|nr:metallophosphoesterase [Clostridia bacterium]
MRRTVSILLVSMCLFVWLTAAASAPLGTAVTLVYTHDLHSSVESHAVKIDNAVRDVGGFARLKTLIDEAKETNEATFVVDAGDFSMGTIVQTIYQERASELVLMGALGYDATTIGNHELDYRDTGLTRMLNAAIESGGPLPELVASNLTATDA